MFTINILCKPLFLSNKQANKPACFSYLLFLANAVKSRLLEKQEIFSPQLDMEQAKSSYLHQMSN